MADELSIRFTGDEHKHPLTTLLGSAFKKALALDTKLPAEILRMNGMSGRKYRMFINNLIASLEHARYLEIGSWTGSTACSAIFGNRVKVTCIDNWSEFGGPKESFLRNIGKYRSDQIDFSLIEADFRCVNFEKMGPFNVYLFDGPHTYRDQFDGVLSPLKALDMPYILVVDDWNWSSVRQGTLDALRSRELEASFSIEIRTTQDDTFPVTQGELSDWHNGYFLSVLST